ncbi:Glycine-rich RNA-binding protein 7 [Prunus yedoensis var. nudiflora]|uniref:Glycine-rich RNA-binding protein 7 n=1 Tax=Prunus yedoensis var. nudiflora TaxID=2094558 RepID=A0A314XMP9_PRUYE|nr:Glycine-rich RNA-binding protein 7 [Prunus yedoensis var. nudiflora]
MASAEIEFRCFVGGLAWATDNDALERAFSPFGEIIESKIGSSTTVRPGGPGASASSPSATRRP